MGSVTVFATGEPLPPGEIDLTYYSPEGEFIRNPPEDMLRNLIFEYGQDYFQSGWGGGALSIMRYLQDGGITNDRSEPSLEFTFLDWHGFYFHHHDWGEGYHVPWDGSGRRELVEYWCGGNPERAPVACFVSRANAWAIMDCYRKTRRRWEGVQWISANNLYNGDMFEAWERP
jgi:hypothetical protein